MLKLKEECKERQKPSSSLGSTTKTSLCGKDHASVKPRDRLYNLTAELSSTVLTHM